MMTDLRGSAALIVLASGEVETTELPDFSVRLARLAVCTVIVLFYVFDFASVMAAYRKSERRTGMALRSVIRSSQILFGVVIIWIGALSVAFFPHNDVSTTLLRYSGYVLLGGLLVGGGTLVWSHLRGEPVP